MRRFGECLCTRADRTRPSAVLGFAPSTPHRVAESPRNAMKNISIALALTIALAACSQPGADQSASTAAPKAEPGKAAAPLDQPATPSAPTTAAQMTDAKLDPILAGAWRSDASKARDQYRHPKQTLDFL